MRRGPPARAPLATRIALGAEVTAALLVAGTRLRRQPFERVLHRYRLAPVAGSVTGLPRAPARHPDPDTRRVGRALERLARLLYPRRPCLPAALAGHLLLARRGRTSDVILGVARRPGAGIDAHAWLVAGQGIVTGAGGGSGYVPVTRLAAFPARTGRSEAC